MSRPALRAAAVLALLAVLGWHVHARLQPEADLNFADRALLTLTGPVQKAMTRSVSGVGGVFSTYFALVGTNKENEELRKRLAIAEAKVAENAELRAQNDRLRDLVGLQSRVEGETLTAAVIGRGTSSRFRTLRIDRGTGDGLEPGMAVISSQGAVGSVLRASRSYADVLLITDGLSSVGAVVQRSRARAVGVGDGDGGLELGYIRRSDLADVAEGDLVVTSGEDGVFPEGVPLGSVQFAQAAESGLFVEARVETAVRLDRADEVLVITDPGRGPYQGGSRGPVIASPLDEELLADPWGPPLLDAGDQP
ncbi:MAG: rod shape-determining protein MreC [Deltaproteobacteria bacterium]|nr:rod shape-determining protein MreC [Deltaproteobacteria bacterium]